MKQTEIGLIPEDWEVVLLKDTVELRKEKVNPLTSKVIYRCVELESIVPETGRIIGEIYSNEVVSLKTRFYKNDVLFGKLRPYLRKYAFPKFDGVCTSEIWVLNSKYLNHKFLFYTFQTDRLIETANQSTGTKMPRAEWSVVSNLQIPLPPLPEQEAIASALSDADAWIESLAQLIVKKRLIKQGAMQELLTPPDGSQNGVEPWEVKKLGEVLKSVGSGTSNTQSDGQIFPIYGSTGIIGFKNYYDYEGDNITIARVGANAGRVNSISGKYCVSDNTLLLVPSNEIEVKFLFYVLKKANLNSLVFGSGQPLITGGQLKTIEIPFPSLSEQTRIAMILSDMDAELEALEQRLAKARQIKQGMMQELLTGRVRLL